MILRACLKLTVGALSCASVVAFTADAGATNLTLINGWHDYPSSASPAIMAVDGVAHFKGAMATAGANPQPFVLPQGFRPMARVYAKADLCNAHNGRLVIGTDGSVLVDAEGGDFAQAQCFTSLDGVSFALTKQGFKAVKLKHGWKETVYGTAAPAVGFASGMVFLEGAMASGRQDPRAFTLPLKYRPGTVVYLPADMFGAANGRVIVGFDGAARVQSASDGGFDFTSLEGISFAVDNAGFTPVVLTNGWQAFLTRAPAVRRQGKLVQFLGAITGGTSAAAFVLPSDMRPSNTVYVPVDLCDAANGRLKIGTDGTVSVEAEEDFSAAQCFTSLEGVSFLP